MYLLYHISQPSSHLDKFFTMSENNLLFFSSSQIMELRRFLRKMISCSR